MKLLVKGLMFFFFSIFGFLAIPIIVILTVLDVAIDGAHKDMKRKW